MLNRWYAQSWCQRGGRGELSAVSMRQVNTLTFFFLIIITGAPASAFTLRAHVKIERGSVCQDKVLQRLLLPQPAASAPGGASEKPGVPEVI